MSYLKLENLPLSMQSVAFRPLMVLSFKVSGPLDLGKSPAHDRKIGIITGGHFEGERLRGRVLSGGSDWQTVRADDSWTMNVRVILETEDNALISMTYQGIRAGAADILKKLPEGGVGPEEYYFRTNPLFETSSTKYGWMNRIIAVGTGHRLPEGPVYSIFEII